MKRALGFATLILLAASTAGALDLSLGVKAGPAVVIGAGGPTPEDYVSFQPGFAWSAGIAADVAFSDFFAVEINGLFAAMYQFGYNADPAINGIGLTRDTLTVSTLEVPILAKFRFGRKTGRWTASAGPDVFILMGNGPKIFRNDVQIGTSQEYEKDALFGMVVSFGYEYPLKTGGTLTLELRFTKPLNYFYTAEVNPQGSDAGYQRLDLMFGYYFF